MPNQPTPNPHVKAEHSMTPARAPSEVGSHAAADDNVIDVEGKLSVS